MGPSFFSIRPAAALSKGDVRSSRLGFGPSPAAPFSPPPGNRFFFFSACKSHRLRPPGSTRLARRPKADGDVVRLFRQEWIYGTRGSVDFLSRIAQIAPKSSTVPFEGLSMVWCGRITAWTGTGGGAAAATRDPEGACASRWRKTPQPRRAQRRGVDSRRGWTTTKTRSEAPTFQPATGLEVTGRPAGARFSHRRSQAAKS